MTHPDRRAHALDQLVRAVALPPASTAAFNVLDTGELELLAQLVADARARDRRDLDTAINEGLKHVPALLRGAVIRILRN